LIPNVLLLALSSAWGFCGTYVAAPGSSVTNEASHVIVAREGNLTTLTLANDFAGDVSEFALLIPVPEVLGPEDVGTVAQELVERIDAYGSPRQVAYTCEDAFTETHSPGRGPGCGLLLGCKNEMELVTDVDGERGEDADGSVTVEAAFAAAEYDIVVLSAEQSAGLFGWLDENGFSLPAGGDDIVQDYIDAGSYFLAAKVRLDAAPSDRQWLSPLQITYSSAVFSLPIRIGTISSGGVQDMIVTVLAGTDLGQARISNYPEVPIEDDCMWRGEGDDFGAFYAGQLESLVASDGVGWTIEHSWDLWQKCDPCTTPSEFTPEEMYELGSPGNVHLTRLRMRYRPDAIGQDVVFYFDNQPYVAEQTRFLRYDRQLEFLFPVCGDGWVENPGECGDEDEARGCVIPGNHVGGAFLAVGLLIRRRRR
jgi:hypothetical protein